MKVAEGLVCQRSGSVSVPPSRNRKQAEGRPGQGRTEVNDGEIKGCARQTVKSSDSIGLPTNASISDLIYSV